MKQIEKLNERINNISPMGAVVLFLIITILITVVGSVLYQLENDTSGAYLQEYIPDDLTWVHEIDSWGLTIKGGDRADIYQMVNPYFLRNDVKICELFCKNEITILVETKGLEATYANLSTGYRQECMSGAQSKVQLQLETTDHETIVINSLYEISPPDTSTCPNNPPTTEATKYAVATALIYIMGPESVEIESGTPEDPLSINERFWLNVLDLMTEEE